MSKYFFRNQPWGPPVRILGRSELGCYGCHEQNSRNESNEKASGEVNWPHCHYLFIE